MEIKFTKINCEDGFELTVTIYFPKAYKAAVIIAPATGIKRTFYNSFASFLESPGTLIFPLSAAFMKRN